MENLPPGHEIEWSEKPEAPPDFIVYRGKLTQCYQCKLLTNVIETI